MTLDSGYKVYYTINQREVIEDVPPQYTSVYAYARDLHRVYNIPEIDVYFRGRLVDTYKNKRSTRNLDPNV